MAKIKKLWGIFDKRPLIWFHYALLSAFFLILVTYNFLSVKSGLDFINNSVGSAFGIFAVALIIGIFDQIVHKILGAD